MTTFATRGIFARMDVERQLARAVGLAKQDPEIVAAILFGSVARGEQTTKSDVDLCLVMVPAKRNRVADAQKRLAFLTETDLDVQIFQQLPLVIRSRVLKEGKVLYARDEALLYEIAFHTCREWEDFRRYHDGYLAEVARGRP